MMEHWKSEIEVGLKLQITAQQAWNYRIIPDSYEAGRIKFLIDQTKNINGIRKELQIILGKSVELENADSESIDEKLKRNYPRNVVKGSSQNILKLISDKDSFVSAILNEAINLGSSDIHIEAFDSKSRIRFRVDGLLLDKYEIPVEEYPSIINTIKIKANLDISEKRLPQDGRIVFKNDRRKMDIRVSVIPTIYKEKIVLRLLNKDAAHIDLEDVGFDNSQIEAFKRGIEMSHGLILISGPTGSGKTTTLYAALKRLNLPTKNILTIEDPIEYTLNGINQVQLKESIGLTFPSALRTFLRQDPDIIMVGEIRDPDTAGIAIRAALTGHLVLSTIHTNSALGIISRLVDMGIQNYLIAGTLNIAIAQRLVRLLCPQCKRKSSLRDPLFNKFLPEVGDTIYEPVGCEHCNHKGYKGRRAIFEIIEINQNLRESIRKGGFEEDFLNQHPGFSSLANQAKQLIINGSSSFEEVLPILLNE